jgi:RNA polymerase sigma-70 factor (ECF subfamily)
MRPSSDPVSELLSKWKSEDQDLLHTLVPLVYRELRRLAHNYLQEERPGHTLQTTALVHEAYLRLRNKGPTRFENRAHFFAISAQLMRQILVDHARGRLAAKRGGGNERVTLDDVCGLMKGRGVDLIALDDALNSLAQLDPHQSQIVELRFFGGLSIEETADVLGISAATVKRHWSTARVWLYQEMCGQGRT